ncbi:hypothetical protein GYMLUDRAFT_251886 [Collybiopsis luxurians FD-317 M1]|uniref:Unplaced genomic scaffold GYMLUscaffold_110, whole genome shotgun sequence n=1 Tax=Collybiopsis luxurians FD-317 M1 TaxID=944289 RepID=A0A0D0BPY6_9AGAR|nr:hypothetical protein GYMLUDRAFT_251886 [Collybiopsis luxurians FD-317 M1]
MQSFATQSSASHSLSAQSSTSLSILTQTSTSQSSMQLSFTTSQSSGPLATQLFNGTHSSFPSQSPSGTVSHRKSTSTAVIAGSVVGSVAAFIIFTLGVLFFLRRRRTPSVLKRPNRSQPEPYNAERQHPEGIEEWNAEKTFALSSGTRSFRVEPTASSTSSPVSGSNNTSAVAQVIFDAQRLQAQIEGDETSTIASEAPPPTYVSG